ncbi:serine/threonine-protein kinase PknG [Catenuloplanes nepalensis]|uniref:non-specific serine/threonine protein kinase n=1 Tax=Catenuloplanes nepalensis TaxID=587533 RepID=A0ABT9MSF2_9ACTN|nr:serine/threonine-protein kinase [Catenuloplanes nepalensis]MDP9794206.1 serine/threonine-protein kinase PknG [Catenuloplanes nepalensis]
MRCNRPGCTGEIDETGFCGECNHRPLPQAAPDASPGGCGAPGCGTTGRQWSVNGIVTMPTWPSRDPTSRIMAQSTAFDAVRRCGRDGCDGRLNPVTASGAPRVRGFCPKCGKSFSLEPRLKPGDLVADQYRIEGPLARSGFGWVFLARDEHLDNRYVVLKGLVNANDARAAEMAVRERQYLTRLDHPNIVRIYNAVTHYDAEMDEHLGYIVMDYIDGDSLQQSRLTALRAGARCGRRDVDCAAMPLDHVLGYGLQILAALEYLHDQGLVYCDLKPDNVMRGADRIVLIDLGGVTEPPGRGGAFTPPFAPSKEELKEHGATVRSDVFSLGKTLEYLLRAGVDRSPELGRADPGGISVAAESFRRAIRRATADDLEDRFAGAAEFAEQLTGVVHELNGLRHGIESRAPSARFAPTSRLIDAGLGSVPPLTRWTAPADPAGAERPPEPEEIMAGLPLPRVDPADPAARYLAGGDDPGPRELLGLLAADSAGDSAELLLRGARAHLELGDPDAAWEILDRAAALLPEPGHRWRLGWFRGLAALAQHRTKAALDQFAGVCDMLPGEAEPKLAMALCAESLQQSDRAERLHTAVWRRDRSMVSAAFGLARTRLARQDRDGAVAVLDEVPAISLHRDAARIAAVRALVEPVVGHAAQPADVLRAATLTRPDRLRLDHGEPDGKARQRLTALVRQIALDTGVTAAAADPVVLGSPCTRNGLRDLLERSLRDLARQAAGPDESDALVDLANRVRTRTLLTGWRH